jgi:hypothetical protein
VHPTSRKLGGSPGRGKWGVLYGVHGEYRHGGVAGQLHVQVDHHYVTEGLENPASVVKVSPAFLVRSRLAARTTIFSCASSELEVVYVVYYSSWCLLGAPVPAQAKVKVSRSSL